MPCSFGQQQFAQGIRIGGERVGVENHAMDSTRTIPLTKGSQS
jgi:hypothetical protein